MLVRRMQMMGLDGGRSFLKGAASQNSENKINDCIKNQLKSRIGGIHVMQRGFPWMIRAVTQMNFVSSTFFQQFPVNLINLYSTLLLLSVHKRLPSLSKQPLLEAAAALGFTYLWKPHSHKRLLYVCQEDPCKNTKTEDKHLCFSCCFLCRFVFSEMFVKVSGITLGLNCILAVLNRYESQP